LTFCYVSRVRVREFNNLQVILRDRDHIRERDRFRSPLAIDLLSELGYPSRSSRTTSPVLLICRRRNVNYAAQSRHILIKWAFYTQEYKIGTLPTEEILADLLTKNLSGKIVANMQSRPTALLYPVRNRRPACIRVLVHVNVGVCQPDC
jgi:hypothetical protein